MGVVSQGWHYKKVKEVFFDLFAYFESMVWFTWSFGVLNMGVASHGWYYKEVKEVYAPSQSKKL